DDDGGWDHIGVLSHRELEHGDQTDQGDGDGKHGREDRPANEEMRKVHVTSDHFAAATGSVGGCGLTRRPGRTRRSPSVMTDSPGFSPEATTRSPSIRAPRTTGRN